MSQNVQVGQVWNDLDSRRSGRSFMVEAVLNDGRALIKPLVRGSKMTKISLNRFKPWKYRLQSANYVSVPSSAPPVSVTSVTYTDASLALADSVTYMSPLVMKCKSCVRGDWKSEWPHTATLSSGCLELVVRNFDCTSFDVKIKLDGLVVDTWVAHHIDLAVVLQHLKDRLNDIHADFVKVMQ